MTADFRALAAELVDFLLAVRKEFDASLSDTGKDALASYIARLRAETVASHPDDDAVDRFAAALKEKLARSRDKGRGGWQTASAEHLSQLLRDHLPKGDPVDIGNFAMMLHQNGQAITPEPVAPVGPTTAELMELSAVCNSPSVFARQLLARYGGTPQQPVPSLEEAFATLGYCYGEDAMSNVRVGWNLRARYSTPPQPVPVAERLPELRHEFEQILNHGRCGYPQTGNIELADRLLDALFKWLPASALPVAGVES